MSNGTTTCGTSAIATSTGTVRLCVTGNQNEVVFVPDKDHLAKNGESKYAVFFSANGGADHQLRALNGNDEGVRLLLHDGNQTLADAALRAATSSKNVKITVDQNREIIGIEVPAK